MSVIWTNFYAVPSIIPRKLLFPLRAFIVDGLRGWRPFLIGLHRCDQLVDIVRRYLSWKAVREQRGDHADTEIDEIISFFIHWDDSSPKYAVVRALSEVWHAVNSALKRDDWTRVCEQGASEVDPCSWEGVPARAPGTAFVEVGLCYRSLKDWVMNGVALEEIERSEQMLAIRHGSGDDASIAELSALAGELIRLCDGRTTVREIAQTATLRDVIGTQEEARIGLSILAEKGYIAMASPQSIDLTHAILAQVAPS